MHDVLLSENIINEKDNLITHEQVSISYKSSYPPPDHVTAPSVASWLWGSMLNYKLFESVICYCTQKVTYTKKNYKKYIKSILQRTPSKS